MSLLMHLDEESVDYYKLRDNYIKEVENSAMASLAEIKNVHNRSDEMSAKEFCEKYNLIRKNY